MRPSCTSSKTSRQPILDTLRDWRRAARPVAPGLALAARRSPSQGQRGRHPTHESTLGGAEVLLAAGHNVERAAWRARSTTPRTSERSLKTKGQQPTRRPTSRCPPVCHACTARHALLTNRRPAEETRLFHEWVSRGFRANQKQRSHAEFLRVQSLNRSNTSHRSTHSWSDAVDMRSGRVGPAVPAARVAVCEYYLMCRVCARDVASSVTVR